MADISRRKALSITLLCVLFAGCTASDPDGRIERDPPAMDLGTGIVLGTESAQPCKVRVAGEGDTATPDWGRQRGTWIAPDAFVVGDTLFASQCDVFVPLQPGEYTLWVSRGIRWEAAEIAVEVPNAPVSVAADLPRAVSGDGWACGDLHVHSEPSFDTDVPMAQRLVAAVAEGLDVVVPTDHDTIGDWDLAQELAGTAERLTVVRGNELTPDQWSEATYIGHIGVFPLPTGFEPGRVILPGTEISALLDAVEDAAPGALLQVHHPRWNHFIGWFEAMMWDAAALAEQGRAIARFDAVEVWNGHELSARPDGSSRDAALGDWWTLLNAGVPIVATANSDSHGQAVDPMGYPRTCVRMPPEEASQTERWLGNLRRGAAFMTSGPFVDMTVAGAGLGETVGVDDRASVEVEVQAPRWIDVNSVQLVVNGVEAVEAPVTELPQRIPIDIAVERDSWVIAIAAGERPMGPATGAREHPLRSAAITNPIYLDADGDGMWNPPGGP